MIRLNVFVAALLLHFANAEFVDSHRAEGAAQPNIILILTDDQGYGDLGVHGNREIDTPNLDRFASESLEMTRFYVNPLCSPTRASLMTGRYYLRTGVLHTSRGAAKMWGDEFTIAEALKESGYRTGIFGKWHLGDNYPMRPQDQGFDEVLVHKSGGIGQTPDTEGTYFKPVLWRNGERMVANGYCTDVFFDAALSFIAEKSDAPFFIYLPTNVPHGPLEVSPNYWFPFEVKGVDENVARVYGMLKNLDENFGRLLRRLKAAGMEEDTLVIFMSDNGPTPGRYNAGLRGSKGSVYEGGIRVPFFIRWSGQIEAGKQIDHIAAHIDILPTLLDAAGGRKPAGLKIDGKSLLPLWRGKRSLGAWPIFGWPDRTLFTQHIKSIEQAPYQNATAFNQRFKIVTYPQSANESHFEPDTEQPELALYDIESDFRESKDLSLAQPKTAWVLQRRYLDWYKDMEATRGFQPGRIHLGSEAENPSRLCRYQDGHRPFGTDREPIGWPVTIVRGGLYRIELLEPVRESERIAVSWKGQTLRSPVVNGSNGVEVSLESGDGMIDVWTETAEDQGRKRETDVIVEWLR